MQRVKQAEVWHCPHCNASDYTPSVAATTLAYYPPRIVTGVNVNPDRNKAAEVRHCNACGQDTKVTY